MPELVLPGQPLTDGVVTLREPCEADVPAITAACQDPEIARWTRVPSPYTEEHARRWVARLPGERARGEHVSFAVTDAKEGTLLGMVGLISICWENARAEMGAWMAPGARHQGVARRALRLLSTWAFQSVGMKRLEGLLHPSNVASRRLVETCGYTPEGRLRSYAVMKGERTDLLLFSLLPGEFR
jgi:RimJ/RimL family protein N-acetyltransferase